MIVEPFPSFLHRITKQITHILWTTIPHLCPGFTVVLEMDLVLCSASTEALNSPWKWVLINNGVRN